MGALTEDEESLISFQSIPVAITHIFLGLICLDQIQSDESAPGDPDCPPLPPPLRDQSNPNCLVECYSSKIQTTLSILPF